MEESPTNHRPENDETEIDFLLSNVNLPIDSKKNENSEKKQFWKSPFKKSKSLSSLWDIRKKAVTRASLLRNWSQDQVLEDPRSNYVYLGIGFGIMCITMTTLILLGVFEKNTLTLVIFFTMWIIVCCGIFWCGKRPRSLHVCSAIAVALIFGLVAMISFYYVRDIKKREILGQVSIREESHRSFPDGSIVYFPENVKIASQNPSYIGQTSRQQSACYEECEEIFYCVAPIIDSKLDTEKNPIYFWAGCQLPKGNKDCSSHFFLDSDCFSGWQKDYQAGFVYDKELHNIFLDAVNQSIVRNNFVPLEGFQKESNRTHIQPNQLVIVQWMADPIKSSQNFWTMGWIAVVSAPLMYGGYGILYTFFYGRKVRSLREELKVRD